MSQSFNDNEINISVIDNYLFITQTNDNNQGYGEIWIKLDKIPLFKNKVNELINGDKIIIDRINGTIFRGNQDMLSILPKRTINLLFVLETEQYQTSLEISKRMVSERYYGYFTDGSCRTSISEIKNLYKLENLILNKRYFGYKLNPELVTIKN